MKPLFLLAAGLLAAVLVQPATATAEACQRLQQMVQSNQARENQKMGSTDRCRSSSVSVNTQSSRWETLRRGERLCFRPEREIWQWKCRGYTDGARCRGLRAGTQAFVSVSFENDEVVWRCYVLGR